MLQSNLLLKSDKIIHGFTTKEAGNLHLSLNNRATVESFLKKLGLEKKKLVGFEQVHGSKVSIIGKRIQSLTICGSDGGVTKQHDIVLAINTADCLPILFYDPVVSLVAAIHAGWRGLISGILAEAVRMAVCLGSKVKHMRMAVGPHIGGCCYNVDLGRAEKFRKKFGNDNKMIYRSKDQIHLDLAQVAYREALNLRINKKNIEIQVACTFCQSDRFFSFRKEGKNLNGEMLNFIGLRNTS